MQLLSSLDHLLEMMEELNNSVSTFPSVESGGVKTGLVCAAPSSLDQRWYRVRVVLATNVATSKVSAWALAVFLPGEKSRVVM